MRTLEALATIVTGLLALVGLWTVSIAIRIEVVRRKRERNIHKGASK